MFSKRDEPTEAPCRADDLLRDTEHPTPPHSSFSSVRTRIALAYAVLFCISAAVLMATGYLLLKRHLIAGIDRELADTADRMERMYCGLGPKMRTTRGMSPQLQQVIQKRLPAFNFLAWDDGTVIGTVGLTSYRIELHDGMIRDIDKLSRRSGRMRMQGDFEIDTGNVTTYALLSLEGTPISVLSKRGGLPDLKALRGPDAVIDGYRIYRRDFLGSGRLLVLCAGTEPVVEVLQAYLTSSIDAMFVVLLIGSYAGWFIAHRAMRGVSRVAAAAEAIGNGDLDTRAVYDNDGSEVLALVTTFNTMAGRVQQLLQEQREITDNIAHDLRTPITRIRGTVETSMAESPNIDSCREMAGRVVEDCDHLVNLINATLEISQGDAGTLTLAVEQVDLTELAQQAVALFQPLATDKHQELELSTAGDTIVEGDRSRLQRVLANLLDNAIKYTQDGGTIHVALSHRNSNVEMTIRDNGPGIPAAERDNVFRRFYRCDDSRSTPGNGLGLSLVRAIVQAHHGTVELADSTGGLIIHVVLPKINKP